MEEGARARARACVYIFVCVLSVVWEQMPVCRRVRRHSTPACKCLGLCCDLCESGCECVCVCVCVCARACVSWCAKTACVGARA